jgi:hypothetical protein
MSTTASWSCREISQRRSAGDRPAFGYPVGKISGSSKVTDPGHGREKLQRQANAPARCHITTILWAPGPLPGLRIRRSDPRAPTLYKEKTRSAPYYGSNSELLGTGVKPGIGDLYGQYKTLIAPFLHEFRTFSAGLK